MLAFLDDLCEGIGMMYGKVRQYFSVQFDIRFPESTDQPRVRRSINTGSRVDTGDPKAAKLAFTLTSIAILIG